MCLKPNKANQNDYPGETPVLISGKVDKFYIYANELTSLAENEGQKHHVFVVVHIKHRLKGKYVLLEVVRTKYGIRVNQKKSETLNGAISKRLNLNKPAILWIKDQAKRDHNCDYFEHSDAIQNVINTYHGENYSANNRNSQTFANDVARALKSDRRCQEMLNPGEIQYGFVYDE